jgi:hypothetical protein
LSAETKRLWKGKRVGESQDGRSGTRVLAGCRETAASGVAVDMMNDLLRRRPSSRAERDARWSTKKESSRARHVCAGCPVLSSEVGGPKMGLERHDARRRLIGTVATLVFSLIMTGSGLLFLSSGAPKVAEALGALGYPTYVAKMLGVAKLLGVAALWLPVPRTLREWAYAGFVINLVGAVVSHLASAGPHAPALQPAILLIPLGLSYVLRHRRATEDASVPVAEARMAAWR